MPKMYKAKTNVFFMQKKKQKRTKREQMRTKLQVNFKSKCSCFISELFPLNMKLDVFSFLLLQMVHRDFPSNISAAYAMINGPQLKRCSCF